MHQNVTVLDCGFLIVNKYYRAKYAMTWNLTLVVMGGAGRGQRRVVTLAGRHGG